MAYRQYTKCVSIGNYIGGQYAQVIIAAAVVALPLIFVGVAAGPAVMLVALAAVLAYCRWWLYDRLICLGGDQCAVGWLLKIDPPEEKSWLDRFDTDYSLNLVLGPMREGVTQAQAVATTPQGFLLDNQPAIKNAGLDFRRAHRAPVGEQPGHCRIALRIRGRRRLRPDDRMPDCGAAGHRSSVVCAIPVFGWIACAILTPIAALVVAVGAIVGLLDTANPSDLDENLGELHTNDPTGRGADILFIKGTSVTIPRMKDGTYYTRSSTVRKSARGRKANIANANRSPNNGAKPSNSAGSSLTVASQQQPENQWTIHPTIDGCRPRGAEPDPIH